METYEATIKHLQQQHIENINKYNVLSDQYPESNKLWNNKFLHYNHVQYSENNQYYKEKKMNTNLNANS